MLDLDVINNKISVIVPDYLDRERKSVNLLAMNRRVEDVMSVIVADEGYTFVSSDVGGAEPSFMLGYSGDDMLEFFLKKASGVKPFWGDDGVLMTDSMYVTFASSCALGKDLIVKSFSDWKAISKNQAERMYKRAKGEVTDEIKLILDSGGMAFPECWLLDSDFVKSYFDSLDLCYYKAWKQQVLALFYGEGAKLLSEGCAAVGLNISLPVAKTIHASFWKMFKKLGKFQKGLQTLMRSNPFLTNPFGFRINTEGYKVLNAYIQSSVSGFVSQILAQMDELAPWAVFVMIIHDELIYMIPKGREKDYREALDKALHNLNSLLGFKYPISMGARFGDNFYTAH